MKTMMGIMMMAKQDRDCNCPFCGKPNLIYRPWLFDIICGWCKRTIKRWVEQEDDKCSKNKSLDS